MSFCYFWAHALVGARNKLRCFCKISFDSEGRNGLFYYYSSLISFKAGSQQLLSLFVRRRGRTCLYGALLDWCIMYSLSYKQIICTEFEHIWLWLTVCQSFSLSKPVRNTFPWYHILHYDIICKHISCQIMVTVMHSSIYFEFMLISLKM